MSASLDPDATLLDQRGSSATVEQVLQQLDAELQRGLPLDLVTVATGFSPLDLVLGGGLQAGSLTLVGGAPGVGKTILTLQWARQIALSGRRVIYACYEHEQTELLLRLAAMELAEHPEAGSALRQALVSSRRPGTLAEILRASDVGQDLSDRLARYADRLVLVRASGGRTGLEELAAYASPVDGEPPVLFVDYLQKIPVRPEPANEAEKVTRVTEGLKDLALAAAMPVVCVVAIEMDGLKNRRIRMHDFRGSSALLFESDVALVLNEKARAVSKVHLAYDAVRAKEFHRWVVVTVEKNRSGPTGVDLEFAKDFSHFRFDPDGQMVSEKLVDERFEDL